MSTYKALSCTPSSLSGRTWWPALHATIIESFLSKDFSVFPPTWTRLDPDHVKGAKGLADELGSEGIFVVLLTETGEPVACSGVLPFRGEHWIDDIPSIGDAQVHENARSVDGNKKIADWETCCFCVKPSHRREGLAYRMLEELDSLIKPLGGRRLISNYAVDETGNFWQKVGFKVIPGAGGMLPKGFQTDPDKEGLRADVHFAMAVKEI